ncbi:MAG: DUF309 domain-containing protein [Deltaproteobacteria bacterium]|nr:DUF309 domain-containing protein [Deltaproteobacteria bacterium]
MKKKKPLRPELVPQHRQSLFLKGIELFNDQEFFAAHEPWEEIWRSTTPEPRELYQGLVQLAAGMHHYSVRGNAAPAARLLSKGRRRLESLLPTSEGIALGSLLEAVLSWEHWLEEPEGAPPQPPRIKVVERGPRR